MEKERKGQAAVVKHLRKQLSGRAKTSKDLRKTVSEKQKLITAGRRTLKRAKESHDDEVSQMTERLKKRLILKESELQTDRIANQNR